MKWWLITKKTRETIGDEAGMTGRQVTKYIRLTELIPELLEYIDLKKITISMGVDLSYLDEQIQKWVYEYYKDNGFLKPVLIPDFTFEEWKERGTGAFGSTGR